MESELISASDLARDLRIHKDSVLRIARRLRIDTKMQTTPSSKGKSAVHFALNDAKRIRDQLCARNKTGDGAEADNQHIFAQKGFFYLFQLEPHHDPDRLKVGFTNNVEQRKRDLMCAAPNIKFIKKWPCRSYWEKTAIDAVTQQCEQLHTEVFRARSIDDVIERCEKFFNQMPK